jgi:N6-adenosine-specific RNA methylase IME4/ParB-like chromosome segregation protein Spo0J
VKITQIRVGKRHRAHVGDVRSLAASIAKLGLLHAVVVDAKGRLVAGERRLAAMKSLGWKDIPVRVVRSLSDAANALRAERDENTERKAFVPSETVGIARALEPLERAEAKKRQGTRTDRQPNAMDTHVRGDRRDKLAAVVGVSHLTLTKARAVVEAAERDPERYRDLLKQMDSTGNVHGAHRLLEKRRQALAIAAEPVPLPTGPFRVLVCDPPWRYHVRTDDLTHQGTCPYPDMSVDDICALPIPALAAKDCVLWLWTTNAHMRESFAVLDAWGFTSKSILTWAKTRTGTGRWLFGQTEHCHLAVRGKPTLLLTNQSTLLSAPASRHSEKPDAFYRMVEEMCPGSKVELFARRPHRGFIPHGNAVPTNSVIGR